MSQGHPSILPKGHLRMVFSGFAGCGLDLDLNPWLLWVDEKPPLASKPPSHQSKPPIRVADFLVGLMRGQLWVQKSNHQALDRIFIRPSFPFIRATHLGLTTYFLTDKKHPHAHAMKRRE